MLLLNFVAGAIVYILGKFVAYSVDKWCCNEDTTDRLDQTIEMSGIDIEKVGLLMPSHQDSMSEDDSVDYSETSDIENDRIEDLPPPTEQPKTKQPKTIIVKEKKSASTSTSTYFFREKPNDEYEDESLDEMFESCVSECDDVQDSLL